MDLSLVSDLFHIGPDPHTTVTVLEKIVRPVMVYVFLVVALRLAGKRETAQLSSFDLVVLLTISNTVQNAIIGPDNSLLGGVIGATTLLVVNYMVGRFVLAHPRVERFIEGDAVTFTAKKPRPHEARHQDVMARLDDLGTELKAVRARLERQP
jgi:hypothetical protein